MLALACILGHAAVRATKDGTVPGDVLQLIADVLAARGGEDTVAAAHLPLLHHNAAAFTAAHPDPYAIVPGTPLPAAAWLADEPGLYPRPLAALDRGQLLAALRDEPRAGAAARVGHALLTGRDDLLGDSVNAWRELATGPGGTEAASGFLGFLALSTRMDPADRTSPDTEQVWWTAALDAGLPPAALASAGGFATALPEVWLPLARRGAAHTPVQEDAGQIAERAAAHPKDPDALLTSHLLTGPALGGRHAPDVRRHARTLLQAAQALPTPEHPRQPPSNCAERWSRPEKWTSPERRRPPADLTGPGPGGMRRRAVDRPCTHVCAGAGPRRRARRHVPVSLSRSGA